VYVGTYEGVINPVTAEYFNRVLTDAQEAGAAAVVLRLDTPGGLDTSMRLIIKDITASPVPVIVYVSGGFYPLFRAHRGHGARHERRRGPSRGDGGR
jgi:membrane-bound ClpP family serine protease